MFLYNLWLPITQFSKIVKNLEQHKITYSYQSNSEWSWLRFKYKNFLIIMDSLGFIYIQMDKEDKKTALKVIETILNNETKYIIEDTFLNTKIQNMDKNLSLLEFMKYVSIDISSYLNIKLENISSCLLVNNKKICDNNKIKISLDKNQTIENSSFYNILNRNFCKLLEKSIYFTHGLDFEDGEIYNCLNIFQSKNLKPILNSIKSSNINIKINGQLNEEILSKILTKAIQDTIEEKSILHFLNITKDKYLNGILDKIYITNNSLNKLNSYLLATPNQDNFLDSQELDEEDIEVFVQNLLGSIPKFHNIETKIKETYYIKIGNTITSTRVEDSETIVKTFFYSKWKASIKYFIDTVENIKESLNIYHQNKNLKELEDISYNANYQADIEDIRDLKSAENNIFNEKTKSYINLVLSIFAIITLAGEAPLFELDKHPNIIINIFFNIMQHTINIGLYYAILGFIVFPFIKRILEKRHIKLKIFSPFKEEKIDKGVHIFENFDYDKHEYRSNKSIYSIKNGEDIKVTISYNESISAYFLMKRLKETKITKSINGSLKSFLIFPSLLQETPIEVNYLYRENYRISKSDKVSIKIMNRYKITNIDLIDFIKLVKNDDFLDYYLLYISNEKIDDFSKEDILKILDIKNWNTVDVKLNLYIVYSFVLKLNQVNGNECNYSIVKDQFRVHYHINKLHYKTQKDLERQQEALAQIIFIYFLARLKKFA